MNSRNGYRHREPRVGALDVAVPKLREKTYFSDLATGTAPAH